MCPYLFLLFLRQLIKKGTVGFQVDHADEKLPNWMLRPLLRPRPTFYATSLKPLVFRRFFIMESPGWTRVPAKGDVPSHLVYTKPLEKPDLDKREYRVICLDNGLRAVLIHDEKTDKAAAAMNVGVGNLSDPVSVHPLIAWMAVF